MAHIDIVSITEVHKYTFVYDVPDWNNMNVVIPELKEDKINFNYTLILIYNLIYKNYLQNMWLVLQRKDNKLQMVWLVLLKTYVAS